jgi:hypothetical protein
MQKEKVMAPKKSSKKSQPIDLGDSPITVGGGGRKRNQSGKLVGDPYVDLSFLHDDYVPDPDDRDNFVNDLAMLASITVNDSDKGPINRDSEIIIEFKRAGDNGIITITGAPLGVDFNPKKLRYDRPIKKHRALKWTLKQITVDGEVTRLEPLDKIEIHTTTLPARRRRR